MTEAFALQASPAVSTSAAPKPQHFSKFEWSRLAYDAVGQYGECVVRTLFETLGRDELIPGVESFVSVVWRTQKSLVRASPVTRKPWARWVKCLSEAGLLVEIASGLGRQRFIVLKFPEWDIFDALEYAALSLRRYSQRSDLTRNQVVYVRNKVLPPVLKEWRRQVALESYEDHKDTGLVCAELKKVECMTHVDQVCLEESTQTLREEPKTPPFSKPPNGRGSRSQAGGGPDRSLIYREPMETPLEGGDSSDLTRVREALSQNPPANQNQGGSGSDLDEPETTEADTSVELDVYRQLKRVFIAMFGQFERRLDPGCASRLTKLYLERGAWPEAMKLTLEEKLTRLFGDGFSTGQVIRFLSADVGEWTPPPGLHDEPEAFGAPPERICEETPASGSWTPPPTEEALACALTGATPLGRRRAEQVWARGLAALQSMVSAHLMSRWFEPFVALECVDGRLYGMAPDDFCAVWMGDKHAGLMADACGLEVVVLSPEQVVERYETRT